MAMSRNLGLEEETKREARNLGLEGETERVLLRNLQHFISLTPPELRCPCKRGLVLDSQSHYPGRHPSFAARARDAEEKMAQEKVAEAKREMAELSKR